MKSVLARHDEIVCAAIEGSGGHIFSTAGDSYAAAFPAAQDAVRSAAESQLAVAAEGGDLPVKVRMGVHTGEADERGNDYFGPVVNQRPA